MKRPSLKLDLVERLDTAAADCRAFAPAASNEAIRSAELLEEAAAALREMESQLSIFRLNAMEDAAAAEMKSVLQRKTP
jgi:hypothetical protein